MARRKLRNKTGFTYIVFFSGGMGSWAALMRTVEQARPVDTIIALFTDTKAEGDTHPHRGEDPDTYRFMKEVQVKLADQVTFVDIADGRDIWRVFRDVRYMGNTRHDPCSAKLKRELAHAFVERFDPNTTILVIGIDWQELQRIPDNVEAWKPYIVRFPMCEKPLMTKKQIIEWCRAWGVEPPQLYEFGFDHNNCGGFCVKAGLGQFYKLWLHLYERYRYHERQQEKLFKILGNRYPFLRKTINGKLMYLSLQEYRYYLELETIEALPPDTTDMADTGGCGCFSY